MNEQLEQLKDWIEEKRDEINELQRLFRQVIECDSPILKYKIEELTKVLNKIDKICK